MLSIFLSMPLTVCLPSITAESSLFAVSITFVNVGANCHGRAAGAAAMKFSRPAGGFTSLRDGSARPLEVQVFIPGWPTRYRISCHAASLFFASRAIE